MSEIVIGGVAHTLKFNSAALEALELQSGTHVGWFFNELAAEGRCGFAVGTWLVWAGLQHEAKPPTRDELRAAIDALVAEGDGRGPWLWKEPLVLALSAFIGSKKKTPATASPSPSSATASG